MADNTRRVPNNPTAPAQVPEVLMRAHGEITSALEMLRQSRGALGRGTIESVHQTRHKLQEVSSATEMAASDMLDGLDRALALVDRLETEPPARGDQLRGALRDELFRLIGCFQFQDITAQQLRHVSNVLQEVEQRLAAIAHLVDTTLSGSDEAGSESASAGGATFDPGASMLNASDRQAVADRIFTAPREP